MLKKIRAEISFYRLLLNDPETPRFAKGCLYFALAYLASPIDLIPDFIPVLGQLDDFVIVGGLLLLARAVVPRAVKERCRAAANHPGPNLKAPDPGK